jgi:quercetin dioxygenase-like cupin family protein
MERQVSEIVRELRESRSLSVRTLAAKSGFSPSFISQIENGQASPSISSLEKIALALGVTLVEFFGASESNLASAIRAVDRPRLQSGWSKAEIENLAGNGDSGLEPLLITIKPGGSSGKAPHSHLREQFVFLVAGSIVLWLEADREALHAGDAITIHAGRPYRWVNESAKATQMLVVSTKAT